MEDITHVLLVDDDSESNSSNEKLFRRAGFKKVKTTLNGGHALVYLHQINELLATSKIVILLDTSMPIMDGFEFMKNYKMTNEFHKENILIIVQGELSPEDKIHAEKMGVTCFVEKPVKMSVVQEHIKKHFGETEKNEKAIIRKFPYNNQEKTRAAV